MVIDIVNRLLSSEKFSGGAAEDPESPLPSAESESDDPAADPEPDPDPESDPLEPVSVGADPPAEVSEVAVVSVVGCAPLELDSSPEGQGEPAEEHEAGAEGNDVD